MANPLWAAVPELPKMPRSRAALAELIRSERNEAYTKGYAAGQASALARAPELLKLVSAVGQTMQVNASLLTGLSAVLDEARGIK